LRFYAEIVNVDGRSMGAAVDKIFGNLHLSGMRQQEVSHDDCLQVHVVNFDEK